MLFLAATATDGTGKPTAELTGLSQARWNVRSPAGKYWGQGGYGASGCFVVETRA